MTDINFEEMVKMSIYGAGCTQDYAEKCTEEIMRVHNLIKKHLEDEIERLERELQIKNQVNEILRK